MFWRINTNSILDVEACSTFTYRSSECGDWISGPEETYKWRCHKAECGTTNTSNIEEQTPLCSGDECDHRKCANCTNLKNEGDCLLVGIGTTSGLSGPNMWYCCNCMVAMSTLSSDMCYNCGHKRCAYCANE